LLIEVGIMIIKVVGRRHC